MQVAEAYLEVKKSREWPYIVALGVLAVSIIPLAWYFLLGRIRELSNAIKGK